MKQTWLLYVYQKQMPQLLRTMFTFFSTKFNTETLFHEESSHMEVLCKKRCSQNSLKKHQLPAGKFIKKRIR